MKRLLLLGLMAVLLMGCTGLTPAHIEGKRQQLLKVYPLQVTTRADVHRRWSPQTPDFVVTRPADGWSALGADKQWIRAYVENAEKRVQASVASCERFWGADGMFSLWRCWFYYDQNGKLVDVDWQWMSD